MIITSVEVGSNTLVLLGGTQEGTNAHSSPANDLLISAYAVNTLLCCVIMCNIRLIYVIQFSTKITHPDIL